MRMAQLIQWLFAAPDQKVAPILRLQRWRSKPLDILANIASFLCDEEFYVVMATIFIWTVPHVGLQVCAPSNPLLARLQKINYYSVEIFCGNCLFRVHRNMLVLMAVGFTVGNIMKNLLCVSRPLSPPVFRVRKIDEEDYSFPSTHSLQALSQPIFFTYLVFFQWGIGNTVILAVWILASVVVSATIMISRMYLGAHHVQDVFAGAMLGVIIGVMWCVIGPWIDVSLQQGSWLAPLTWTAVLALLVAIHPNQVYIHHSRAHFHQTVSQAGYLVSATVTGCASGAIFGSWFAIRYADQISVTSITEHPRLVLLRFLVGPICCAAVYVLCKLALRPAFIQVWKILGIPIFDPPHKMGMEGHMPQPAPKSIQALRTAPGVAGLLRSPNNGQNYGYQIMPYVKFLQYGFLTFAGFFPLPLLYHAMGI